MQNRRKFLQNGLLTVGTALTSTSLLKAAETNHIAPAKISIKQNDIILFQGDSITDHSRAKDNPAANNLDALGHQSLQSRDIR
jgi:hypothetical protein